MAGSDNAPMVATASNAGVLGSLGAQYRTPDEMRKTIREIREATSKPFAVNLFALGAIEPPAADAIHKARASLLKYYSKFSLSSPSDDDVRRTISAEEQLQVVLEERVPVFSFTLGLLDPKWLKSLKANGTIIIGTATNVREARALEEQGVDAITVQGVEAGGHRGTFSGGYESSLIGLMALIPQVVDTVRIPIIAAGGIMDGRGIAAAFTLGAAGVQMGTAFLTTNECPVHSNYKNAILAHECDETTITSAFSGGAARGIRNKFIEEQQPETDLLPFPYHNALTRPIRKAANEIGDTEMTNLWCGQAGRLARRLTTQELVRRLVNETEEALARVPRFSKSEAE
jgi:nitronate monooxygenase